MLGLRLIPKTKSPSWPVKFFWLALMMLLIFAIVAVFIALFGADPLVAYWELFLAPIRNEHTITEIFVTATPLLFISLGLSVSYAAKFWNIGAEGQFYTGALFATTIVMALGNAASSIPSILLIPLLILASIVGGALWALIPALLTSREQDCS